jgi:uncharacterized protein (DUF1499 family)
VLKKMIIVATVAVAAAAGGIGVASAHEAGHSNNAKCSQSNDTTQKHKGDALLSNTDIQDITANVLGLQATKPSGEICPNIASGNHL